MAPGLGRDLGYVADLDPSVRVLDGNDALAGGDAEAREALLAEADVLLVGYPVPRDLVRCAPRLRWAHHTQAGVSNLRSSDLWPSSVLLTSSRGAVATTAIAEYVVAAALFFARGLHEATRQKAAQAFAADGYDLLSASGATIGVIGLGGIGQEVARLARPLGMRLVAVRRSATERRENVDGVDLLLPPDRLLELAAESDFVAVCAQRTPETEGLVDARVFDAMKPTAVLINVARGEIVDEEALVEAVRRRAIRGAVLDVYEGELDGRPPRRELLELPEIVLTPHVSGRGDPGSAQAVRRLFRENLRRFLDDEPLVNVVDRSRGY